MDGLALTEFFSIKLMQIMYLQENVIPKVLLERCMSHRVANKNVGVKSSDSTLHFRIVHAVPSD